jgi:uncharacterized membrane protein YbhN (UPF0104 family)
MTWRPSSKPSRARAGESSRCTPIIGLAVLAVAAVLAWFLLRASWRPQAWRGESGQGLVEVLIAVFLVVVAMILSSCCFRLI